MRRTNNIIIIHVIGWISRINKKLLRCRGLTNIQTRVLGTGWKCRLHSLHCRGGYISRYSDSLRAGRSGDRIPVVARFSAPVQTGPEAHPASYTVGTRPFSGVKRPRRGFDHPPPSSAEVKERVELYLYSTSGPSWPVLWWNLPLHLHCHG
jgi:hypothetical protein